ncbi:MAG: efflux RND transporter periplasmic adaptor subunit [Bacteroidetes bacterium HGW-Bacteroidetes-1]|jgi:RND family efflux transporter MFP subunit|nr:MAG: efflux RND transporter periplasmic adaptor subunit [Bacteroidetes bacterium HGW-Bacteroidetes-1]
MNYKIFLGVLLAFAIASCSPTGHENEKHEDPEAVKFQYTSYSNNFELFAEADAFIVGVEANVLSHFSVLPDFKAVEHGSITIVLAINGKEVRQKLDKPTRKGIYSFNIIPETAGKGTMKFEISNEQGNFVVDVPEFTVFSELKAAEAAASKIVVSETNATFFTKEQSWKVDFATDFPTAEPFGQVIKTTALVQSSQGSELVVSAKTNGIVLFNSGVVIEGREVTAGQSLFSVSGGNFADNNIAVKYTEAKSNFEKASADYERSKELAKDKIVSEKDLLSAKNQYENTKAVFDNLNKNFNASGQTIASPQAGFIKQVFVKNGAYVDAGQPIAVVSQNKSLVLNAEVPSKYVPVLANIKTANIRSINDNRSFSLEQLNGKVLSYGKAANSDNYLIPVVLQIENNGSFVSGSFVEVYLKTFSDRITLVVPTTSLLEEQGTYFVWVQVHPELFEKREVIIGGTDGLKAEIKQGISPADRIVTRGAMLIKLAQATGTLDAHSGHVH